MTEANQATVDYSIRLADDALILGQRLSEWCSNGPTLEEDLALANVALDFIGRAQMFYAYASRLAADGRSEDDLAFGRDCREFRNLLITELPRGDFAFTLGRQLIIDLYNELFLAALARSRDEHLAAIAAKAVKETHYHVRRSREWIVRLGDGTDESHRRVQKAFDDLWGYVPELFQMDALEQALCADGIAVDRASLREPWQAAIAAVLKEATLELPEADWSVSGGREGLHTEHLGHLLAEMQFLQRAYPGLEW